MEEPETEQESPQMVILKEFEARLKPEETTWVKEQLLAEDKKTLLNFKVYNMTKDADDFINSL